MKNTPLLALGVLLCAPLGLLAQNFSGSDDFSNPTVSSTNWSTATTTNGGDFTISSGAVSFIDSGLTTGLTSSAASGWTQNTGSYLADWSVQMDFTTPSVLAAGEVASWAIVLQSSVDGTDYFAMGLQKSYSSNPLTQALVYTNDSAVSNSSTLDLGSTTSVSLRVSYTASSNTFTAAYDANGATGGYAFTDLWSAAAPTDWNLVSGSTFTFIVKAIHTANASAVSGFSAGTLTADNFLATGAAVPEPATYALLAGLAVLALGWRRRSA